MPTIVAEMSSVLEYRATSPDVKIVRAADESAQRFNGHAAVFNQRTDIGNPLSWGWREEVAPGAFDKTLEEGDARFLIDHNSSALVARVSAGDLRLSTDSVGLAVDADLDAELSYVRDLVRHLESRRITGMSFGFYVVRDEWSTESVEFDGNKADIDVRTIQEVRLLEVSAVTFPAYEQTDAGLRTVREARGITTDVPEHEGETPAPAEATQERNAAPAVATQRVMRELLLDLQSKRLV